MSALVTVDQLRALNRGATEDRATVLQILRRAAESRVALKRGLNRKIERETALIDDVGRDSLTLSTTAFDWTSADRHVLLSLELEGEAYIFSVALIAQLSPSVVKTTLPTVLLHKERRDRTRAGLPEGAPERRVLVSGAAFQAVEGMVLDESPSGLGLKVPISEVSGEIQVRFLGGERAGVEVPALVRHTAASAEGGWLRLGVETAATRARALSTTEVTPPSTLRRSVRGVGARARYLGRKMATRIGVKRPSPRLQIERFRNEEGHEIAALIDSWGDPTQAFAVVIPPAWGRTKETLVALARTIIATFSAVGQPVVVVRFDGIGKRGESYREASCQSPGSELHRFTFSQGVRDILSVLEHLGDAPAYRCKRFGLVTFSAASLEGRRAVVEDSRARVVGWVSVVGTADLQSMMRVVSGGVDYVGGVARGLKFGRQEVLGVEVDIDLAGHDAIENQIAFIEDSRRDFERIACAVTWFHGRFDAWMDLNRVRDVLSSGDTRRRRLVLVPMGHQMRTSTEALEVFQAIAGELATMALGVQVKGRIPDLADIEERSRLERARIKGAAPNLRRFWHDYLLGRDETVGIELMTASSAYRDLMALQVRLLEVREGDRVLDLGCGVGDFASAVSAALPGRRVSIVGCDLVREALLRGRRRNLAAAGAVRFEGVHTDLSNGGFVPLRSCSMESVMASLLLSYLPDPAATLREVLRVLKPGGRLVLSCLRKDADISKIFHDGLAELRSEARKGRFDRATLEKAPRAFLNEAARLIDYEEQGIFSFWDEDELTSLLSKGGFEVLEAHRSFSTPPQALVMVARRPNEVGA